MERAGTWKGLVLLLTCTRTRGADAPRNVTKAFMNKVMHNIDHGNGPIPGQYKETKVGEGSKVLMPSPQRQYWPVQLNDLWIERLPMKLFQPKSIQDAEKKFLKWVESHPTSNFELKNMIVWWREAGNHWFRCQMPHRFYRRGIKDVRRFSKAILIGRTRKGRDRTERKIFGWFRLSLRS